MISAAVALRFIQLMVAIQMPLVVVLEVEVEGAETLPKVAVPWALTVAMALFLFNTFRGKEKIMSNKWVIKDADGNVTNPCIKGTEDFVSATFDYYEAYVEPETPALTAEQEARQWRDRELLATDYIVPLSDHPQRAAYLTYRTALRDWPSTADFPDTKPTLS
jgi:hypothetical protein